MAVNTLEEMSDKAPIPEKKGEYFEAIRAGLWKTVRERLEGRSGLIDITNTAVIKSVDMVRYTEREMGDGCGHVFQVVE